jgi:hypothetical protein
MPIQNLPVDMRISFGTRNTPDNDLRVEITVVDRASRIVLLSSHITGEDLACLMASRQVIAEAEVPDLERLSKVGMKAENETVVGWPEEWKRETRKVSGSVYRHATFPYMDEWAQEYIDREGWDTYEWRYHNYGWGLIVRRHVPISDEERAALLERY